MFSFLKFSKNVTSNEVMANLKWPTKKSFKIINKIGEGFFADVFLVREKPDDKVGLTFLVVYLI